MTYNLDRSDPVKVSSFIFLNEYHSKTGNEPSGVIYNKFMTLLHAEMKKERIDMRLPHCWYRWGDEVVRYHMPYIRWNHDNPQYTTVSWEGRAPNYDIGDDMIQKIKQFSKDFIEYHSGPEGSELAIDKVYENAPFEFQREYRKLRENLKLSLQNVPPDNHIEKTVMPLFENAMRTFPREFSHISDMRDSFESVFRIAAEGKASRSELFEMIEDFWFFFCYHLRLNTECHENVPRSTLEIWEEKIPWETEMYERNLQDRTRDFYDGKVSNDIADGLLAKWKERDQEFEKLLSEYPDDGLDDLDEFLHRKGNGL